VLAGRVEQRVLGHTRRGNPNDYVDADPREGSTRALPPVPPGPVAWCGLDAARCRLRTAEVAGWPAALGSGLPGLPGTGLKHGADRVDAGLAAAVLRRYVKPRELRLEGTGSLLFQRVASLSGCARGALKTPRAADGSRWARARTGAGQVLCAPPTSRCGSPLQRIPHSPTVGSRQIITPSSTIQRGRVRHQPLAPPAWPCRDVRRGASARRGAGRGTRGPDAATPARSPWPVHQKPCPYPHPICAARASWRAARSPRPPLSMPVAPTCPIVLVSTSAPGPWPRPETNDGSTVMFGGGTRAVGERGVPVPSRRGFQS